MLKKFKTSQIHRRNLTITTIVGDISFDSNLVAELEEDKLIELMDSDSSITLLDVDNSEYSNPDQSNIDTDNLEVFNLKAKVAELEDEIVILEAKNSELENANLSLSLELAVLKPSTSGENSTKETAQSTQSTTIVEETQEHLQIIKELSKNSVEQLKDLAKSQNLPEEEWSKLNKVNLVEYLSTK